MLLLLREGGFGPNTPDKHDKDRDDQILSHIREWRSRDAMDPQHPIP